MHLKEEQVQRLLHNELRPAAEDLVREHLAGCPDCQTRLAEAERAEGAVDSLLRKLDHAPPRVDAEVIAARARAALFAWRKWAAGILLTFGLATTAYAVPGSPLPGWWKAIIEQIGDGPDRSPQAPARAPSGEPGLSGIAVAPGREFIIVFTSLQPQSRATVLLSDGAEVVVRVSNGAATFTSELDRLIIGNTGSTGTFEIRIPRAAPRVEIRVGALPIFLKEGPRVTTEQPPEASGSYLLPLTPPP